MRGAMDNNYKGTISIGVENLTNLQYADDTTKLPKYMRRHNGTTESENVASKINLTKTKRMIIDRGNILPEGHRLDKIDNVNEFTYLAALKIFKRG